MHYLHGFAIYLPNMAIMVIIYLIFDGGMSNMVMEYAGFELIFKMNIVRYTYTYTRTYIYN